MHGMQCIFCRYWHYWLLNNSNYNLTDNFITSNAYCCIELNAHALIILLMNLRDSNLSSKDKFYPCLLGSQPCEKAFRAMRSMSGIFSTIINFSMLGFLRKLHRMHIQLKLEGEMKKSGIITPRASKHSQTDARMIPTVTDITNERILEKVKQAKVEAQNAMQKLGIAESLKHDGEWINPCSEKIDVDISDDDSDSEDNIENDDNSMNNNAKSNSNILTVDDVTQLCADVDNLKAEGIKISDKATSCLPSELHSEPDIHTEVDDQLCVDKKDIKSSYNHDTFFEINVNKKMFKIHKVTAVWLLQEGEKVSSDQLFRVRSQQPYSKTKNLTEDLKDSATVPHTSEVISVGNFCVFFSDHTSPNQRWKIGKVLQFSQYKERLKGKQQYLSRHVSIKDYLQKMGVLCTWYDIDIE